MSEELRILISAAEVVPFAKVGGLADVVGALPKKLEKLGHNVRVIMPKYQAIDEKKYNLLPTQKSVDIPIGNTTHKAEYWKGTLPDSNVEVYFVANDEYFGGRKGIYNDESGEGYNDNDERFVFFCRAIVEFPRKLGWIPDVIHLNDFHTGLVPAYLKVNYAKDEVLRKIPTVFSIHNLGYQGIFDARGMWLGGFDQGLFYPTSPFEYYNKMNFMKTGIVFSDIINTVSEKYAEEIQTPEYGSGLDGVLQSRVNDLYGVLNGIDYDDWNPEKDGLITDQYSFRTISGKRKCKNKLRKRLGMEQHPPTKLPMIGMISRLTDQKGFDILAEVMDQALEMDIQFVLLGTGEQRYHQFFEEVKRKHDGKVGIVLDFDNQLAHQIEAATDMFLMPSKYEPCGLNQLYSLRYGSVPIVRGTGGLADTIIDYDKDHEKGTGFVFHEYTGGALLEAIQRAVGLFQNQKQWKKIIQRGMDADFSWENSAKKYEELYQKAVKKRI